MNKRTLSMMLAVLAVAGAVSACGDAGSGETKETNAVGTTAAVTDAEEIVEDNGRSGVKDDLPADLDLGGQTVRFMVRAGDLDTSSEFIAEATNGDVVNDATFARNQAVEERLNVKIDFIQQNVNRHGGYSGDIRKSVMAGSDDFELVANGLYDTVPLTMEGIFLDLLSLDYLDFEQPWWNQSFFEMTEFNGHNYLALGELSQTMISGTFSMFFNKTMFKEYYPDDPSLYETVNAGE
jgi:ABC-type glycerol-3-phosphate transport system substrate-binding protein